MISEELFFKNHFDERAITNTRLETFIGDMLGRLRAGNTGGRFDVIIDKFNISYPAFTGDISDVDVALTLQKGSTMTVEGVHKLFKTTMSFQEPFIADAIGGRETPAYKEFYPSKITEYSICPQADMPKLTSRVNTAATHYASALGTTRATLLEGFKNQWTTTKAAQELQKGKVSTERDGRNDTRLLIENDCNFAIAIISSLFPGDVANAKTFVNFSLLTHTPRKKHIKKSGTIIINNKQLVANKTFGIKEKVKIENTSDNATLRAYLVLTEDAEPTLFADIKPGKSFNNEASLLGDLSGTMLMLKNMSEVNDVTFIAEYLG